LTIALRLGQARISAQKRISRWISGRAGRRNLPKQQGGSALGHPANSARLRSTAPRWSITECRKGAGKAHSIARFPGQSEIKIPPLLDLDSRVTLEDAIERTSPNADERRL
jgi:hypothetical protein